MTSMAENVFKMEVAEKKKTARSAHSKKSGAGGKHCKMPSDNLTYKQRQALNGECVTYTFDCPFKWAEFMELGNNVKDAYLHNINEQYAPTPTMLATMFDHKSNEVMNMVQKVNNKTYNSIVKNKPTVEQVDLFNKFIGLHHNGNTLNWEKYKSFPQQCHLWFYKYLFETYDATLFRIANAFAVNNLTVSRHVKRYNELDKYIICGKLMTQAQKDGFDKFVSSITTNDIYKLWLENNPGASSYDYFVVYNKITWSEFKALPIKQQEAFLKYVFTEFSASYAHVAGALGVSSRNFGKYVRKTFHNLNKYIPKGKRMSASEQDAFVKYTNNLTVDTIKKHFSESGDTLIAVTVNETVSKINWSDFKDLPEETHIGFYEYVFDKYNVSSHMLTNLFDVGQTAISKHIRGHKCFNEYVSTRTQMTNKQREAFNEFAINLTLDDIKKRWPSPLSTVMEEHDEPEPRQLTMWEEFTHLPDYVIVRFYKHCFSIYNVSSYTVAGLFGVHFTKVVEHISQFEELSYHSDKDVHMTTEDYAKFKVFAKHVDIEYIRNVFGTLYLRTVKESDLVPTESPFLMMDKTTGAIIPFREPYQSYFNDDHVEESNNEDDFDVATECPDNDSEDIIGTDVQDDECCIDMTDDDHDHQNESIDKVEEEEDVTEQTTDNKHETDDLVQLFNVTGVFEDTAGIDALCVAAKAAVGDMPYKITIICETCIDD